MKSAGPWRFVSDAFRGRFNRIAPPSGVDL